MPKKKKPSVALSKKEVEKRYSKLVAKVWADDEFRARLFADPETVLKEAGFRVPEGKKVKVVGLDVVNDFYFILPEKPPGPFIDVAVESVIKRSLLSVFITEDLCRRRGP